jgi:hypothetical protein
MKQFAKQKWVLSALMITALGSQYYFSTSSKVFTTELSSEAAPVSNILEVTDALERLAPAPAVPATTSVPAPATVSVPVTETQAATPTADCGEGCVKLTKEEADRLRKILRDVIAARASAPAASPAANTPDPDETPAEKRARERQEKALAAREAKIERNEEFNLKMEEAVDTCGGDVACVSSRYSLLLMRYSGTKKIDTQVAASAYARFIQPGLRAAVGADGDDTIAQEALRNITMDIPVEYRAIKESSINDIREVARERATVANAQFRLADQQLKANNPAAAQTFQDASAQAAEFRSDMSTYRSTIESGAAGDASTLAYMQRNFMPEISRLWDNMNNLNGLNMATGADGNPTAPAGSRTRGGTPMNPGVDTSGKMTLPGTATWGAPTSSPTGGRVRGN